MRLLFRDFKLFCLFNVDLQFFSSMLLLDREFKLSCFLNVNSQFSPWSQGCVSRHRSLKYSVRGRFRRLLVFFWGRDSTSELASSSESRPVAFFCLHLPIVFTLTLSFLRVHVMVGYPQDISVNVCLLFGSSQLMRFHLYTSTDLFSIYFWSFGCLLSSASGFLQLLDVLCPGVVLHVVRF